MGRGLEHTFLQKGQYERCSTSLFIREVQIKTTSHLTEWLSSMNPQTTSAREDVEKREPSCIGSGTVNCCNHYGKLYGGSSTN